jgi:hypothetical protein
LVTGDVWQVEKVEATDLSITFSCIVHAEKHSAKLYTTTVTLSLASLNVLGSTSVCKNSMNKFGPLYCKHIAALLFALYVLTHHFSDMKFPKGFEHTNMKQFSGACKKLQLQVNFFLTWQQLISNLQTPPPKKRQFSSSYNKIYTEPEPPTKKRKVSEGGDPLLAKKVDELKSLCRERNLKVGGKKAELVERLRQSEKQ